MKIIWIFTLLLYPAFLSGQENTKPTLTKIYNEEGKLQMTIAFDPACSCRSYTEYYTDGKTLAKRVFKVSGRKEFIDGEEVEYHHNGTIKKYKFWKDAVPDGKAYGNHANGKTEYEEFYTDAFKSGTWKFYDTSGRLIQEKTFTPNTTPWNSKKEHASHKSYRHGKLQQNEKTINAAAGAGPQMSSARIPITDGELLFQKRCAACHLPDQDAYGPALNGVTRKRDKKWLFRMIKNGEALVASGDKEAVAIYQQWQQKKHPSQERLDDQQIHAVIHYLEKQDQQAERVKKKK